MDFKDLIKQLSERVEKLKDNLQTEEATKNALVMPFLQALGYDVFNPYEVVPEYTCDVGIKKGEKVDYAIMKDGIPVILIECKHWKEDLNIHGNQLIRYFAVSNAKFGILTNGIVYKFYTDLNKANILDEKPFLVVSMLNISDNDIEQLKKFHKSYYNEQEILSTATQLQIMIAIKGIIMREFQNPSDEFVRYFIRETNEGRSSAKQVEQYTPLVKKSIGNYINDVISDRLSVALDKSNNEVQQAETEQNEQKQTTIYETTENELQGYYIVKSILRHQIPSGRVVCKDNKDYFVINIDNTWNSVCRFYFNNESNLRISLKTDDHKEKIRIDSLDDIFNFSEQLIEIAKKYL